MKNPKKSTAKLVDPIGIENLSRYIEDLEHTITIGDLAAAKTLMSRLSAAHGQTLLASRQLIARYELLKQSNKQLFEEVAWLRDQCDDFAAEWAELVEKIKGAEHP